MFSRFFNLQSPDKSDAGRLNGTAEHPAEKVEQTTKKATPAPSPRTKESKSPRTNASNSPGAAPADDMSYQQNPLLNHPHFKKIKDLNEGTFGFVQLALDTRTSEQVAIKFLERGAGVNKSVLREILNHRLCVVHPNIVQFKEVFLTPNHLAIVMEYAAGGDMFEYVIRNKTPNHGEGLSEDSARGFFQQLLVALEFCHELGIANRDIKLENTLLDGSKPQPNVKICDFGYSKNEFVDSRPKTVSGTPDYIAPEVLLHDQYDGKKADIWSCGVMLYVMLTGVLPFAKRGDDRGNNLVRLQQMFPRIVAADFEQPSHVSQGCKHLLVRMLTADPANRITIPEIMQHPWFQTKLPPGMSQLNYSLVQTLVPVGLQSVEEIEQIVQQATRSAAWPGPSPAFGQWDA